jgi:hypothetical protein
MANPHAILTSSVIADADCPDNEQFVLQHHGLCDDALNIAAKCVATTSPPQHTLN